MSIANDVSKILKVQQAALVELRTIGDSVRAMDDTLARAADSLDKIVTLLTPEPDDGTDVVGIAIEPGVPVPHGS